MLKPSLILMLEWLKYEPRCLRHGMYGVNLDQDTKSSCLLVMTKKWSNGESS